MLLRQCLKSTSCAYQQTLLKLSWQSRQNIFRNYSLYEPPYLNVKPEFPSYETLNVRVRGYDFAVLESYTKYVHHLTKVFELDSTVYPVPARTSKIQSFKPQSSLLQHEYDLALYERTVQIDDLTSITAPLFFEVLRLNMPAGIQLTVKEVDPDEEEFRYVPDLTLRELHAEISELDKAKDDRKRK